MELYKLFSIISNYKRDLEVYYNMDGEIKFYINSLQALIDRLVDCLDLNPYTEIFTINQRNIKSIGPVKYNGKKVIMIELY